MLRVIFHYPSAILNMTGLHYWECKGIQMNYAMPWEVLYKPIDDSGPNDARRYSKMKKLSLGALYENDE